ncbi:hypothetical protein [Amycolatopsis sp. DSM 110486]|uniref:hypothetical protein n=1 Tax=Amycolatopsis sp. DSM 110486 TaxID=2865832 RepID=UPI001C69D086|nr:hypothetical protein [Amycolatopsis sp. DSM 110486]QYN23149.1 hypothetical protein K1T34_12225 [Amycolatopsis sp. DSM 110486]
MSKTTRRHPGGEAGTPAEVVLSIDADCPECGWPERTFTLPQAVFGCPQCAYTSTERGA